MNDTLLPDSKFVWFVEYKSCYNHNNFWDNPYEGGPDSMPYCINCNPPELYYFMESERSKEGKKYKLYS